MSLYLGIDIGTTKIAAVAVDAATGSLIAVADRFNDTEITSVADKMHGRSEWDAMLLVDRTFECVAELATALGTRCKELKGVGVTGQMHGMVLLGPDGLPRTPVINWQDQRCMEMVPGKAKNYIELMIDLAGTDGFTRCGCPPATGYMASTLFWMARNGEKHALGIRACFVPDFIVARLTGEQPATDPTNAAGAGVFDVVRGEWDGELIARLGLDVGVFPSVLRSGSIVGKLTKEAVATTRLPTGLPVVVGCGDNQASFAAAVSEPAETVLLNIGTGSQISLWTPRCITAPGVDTRPHLDGSYLLVGATLCGGKSFSLLHDFFGETGRELFEVGNEVSLYGEMIRLASKVPPGCDGLCCEPSFLGTRGEPNCRAAFHGISAANFTPGHFARAILEGMANQLFDSYHQMLEGGVTSRRQLVGSGNGIRRNDLLARMLADRFAMPLRVPKHTEEAAIGAALNVAGVYAGRSL